MKRSYHPLHAAVCVAAALAAAACQKDIVGPVARAAVGPGSRAGYAMAPSVTALRGRIGEAFVIGYARALADHGNRRMLQHLEGVYGASVGRGASANYLFLNAADTVPPDSLPPDTTTPPAMATILNPHTNVDVVGADVAITPTMTFRGRCGAQTLTPEITYQEPQANNQPNAADIPSVSDTSCPSDWVVPHPMSTPLASFAAPASCGLDVSASTLHSAWYYITPAQIRPPLEYLFRTGLVTTSSDGLWNQPACGSDPIVGGDPGAGQGSYVLMGHYACYYTDHYTLGPDGYYRAYTTFDGCELVYTYWVNQQ